MNRVKALAEALEGSDVSELDVTEGGVRMSLRRRLDAPPVAAPAARTSPSSRGGRRGQEREEAAPEPGVAVVAPVTGVFYVSSSPSSPPFVQVGEPVQAGQVVCIIEAMKVFNEIKGEIGGVVTAIVAQNGQLIRKGEVALRIAPL